MLPWLNRNAAAIQALGSIASIAITVVLVWITARYVSLTQALARAAQEQLRIQQQSAASEMARLITLTDVFLNTLRHLPDDGNVQRIRDAVIWKRGDVTALGSLAASVFGAESHVRQSIQSLNWLREKAEHVQQLGDDLPADAIQWAQWKKELNAAQRSLTALREAAQEAQQSRIVSTDDDDASR